MQNKKDISPELFQEIEKYLAARMTPVERANFEVSLRNNKELKDEVEAQQEILLTLELGGFTESLRKRHSPAIRKIEPDHEDIDTGEGPRYWFAVAASILAFLALSIWILFQQPPINEQLYSEYATEDPGLPVPMSTTKQYVFYDAMVDYKRQDYAKAIRKWTDLHEHAPQNDTLNYFLGSAHFNAESFDLAIPFFEQTLASNSLVFGAKSQWYLVLSWLKTEQYENIFAIAEEALPAYRAKIHAIRDSLSKNQ